MMGCRADRLADAAAPEDGDRLAGLHLEAHIAKDDLFAEGLADVLELDIRASGIGFVHSVQMSVNRRGRQMKRVLRGAYLLVTL